VELKLCGTYMFEFSVSKDMKKGEGGGNDERRISTYLLAIYLTLIVKKLKISVE